MKQNNLLADLLLTFMKIGLFTFGGGYAMIGMIEDNCVEKKKWITHDEMMNITVVAESTPGPIAINCATYVGYVQAGMTGAILTTLGIVLPSFMIIYLISMVLDNFLELTLIANAFQGIKIAVGVLILDAALGMIKKMPKKPLMKGIMVCAFAAMMIINIFALNFSSIALMLIAAVVSLSVFIAKGAPDMKGGAAK
ncbi:MAG: chromate transporter [Peptococcaceae bacterium]|nr:chromate transporter [Peptococcaceae bacterium]